MESKRQRQVSSVIQRHFSEVLRQEGSYIYGVEPLVSVTHVLMSPDLGLAKIYVSVWNTNNKQAVVLQLEHHHHRLKQQLAARVRKHLRRIPQVDFYLDETLDEIEKVEGLFTNNGGSSPGADAEE